MAVPTVSEGESQAMRDSLPQRSPPPVQEEGSQVTEASVQAQIEQQQRMQCHQALQKGPVIDEGILLGKMRCVFQKGTLVCAAVNYMLWNLIF